VSSSFRYEKLGYAALNVTDLDRSIRFYRDLVGLELVDRGEDHAFLRCSHDHHNLVLHRAETAGIRRAAFKMASRGDLDAAFAAFTEAGLQPIRLAEAECAALQQGPSFRVREPNSGLQIECYERMTHMALPFAPVLARIARIGHVVVATPAYDRAVEVLRKSFNFVLSDFVDGKFSWMRCFPNPLHHSFAIGRSDRNHLHHVNFMVSDIDDIGTTLNRMRAAGVPIVFGPGRHLPSTSIFLYFLDPDGLTIEFSFGMELIEEQGSRAPRMLEMHPRTMDLWGSAPASEFGRDGEIERDLGGRALPVAEVVP